VGPSKPAPVASAVAQRFIDEADFVWHQRFEVAPGIYSPGAHDIEWLIGACGLLDRDLDGLSVLDIGTANGGAAFLLERRGAARVVAVDIYPSGWFGFDAMKELLGSAVEYVQASAYELPQVLTETFDVVLFLGLLYHLRHPLLALDAVRSLAARDVFIETAVADHALADRAGEPLIRFYRRDELGNDASNWFAPTTTTLVEWLISCGLEPELVRVWPAESPSRALVHARRTESDPEFEQISYERRLLAVPAGEGSERALSTTDELGQQTLRSEEPHE
jgi:tRNA (mo5U34)-methyltransferase